MFASRTGRTLIGVAAAERESLETSTTTAEDMYSLWRGDVLLGRINPELPDDTANALFGMLDPAADFLPGQAMHQHTMLNWPGTPVFHHVDPPAAAGSSAHRQVASDGPRPLAEAIRDSVPADRQLTLRDAADAPVATRTIAIMAMSRGSQSLQQLCHDAGVPFSGWCVVATLAASGTMNSRDDG